MNLLPITSAMAACLVLAAIHPSGAAPSTAGEYPIHITFVIHFDPLPADQGRVSKSAYEAERDNLAWLADYLDAVEKEKTAAFVPRLTLEMAGDHAEWYMEDPAGLELLRRLHRKGIHCFGTHFHRNYRQSDHVWPDAPSPESAPIVTRDHIATVDKLIGRLIESNDPKKIRAANRIITGHFIDMTTAAEAGFDTLTGGRNEAMNLFFDHDAYNPWRPSEDWPLGEDRRSLWILVPQSPVLGQIGEHAPIPNGVAEGCTRGMRGMIWQDLSVPAMRRKFLHLFLERRDSPEPKAWVFGWHEHTSDLFPADGRRGTRNFRTAVTEFVEWLNSNFIGRAGSSDAPAVRYSNTDEVREAFLSWEHAAPGRSSFAYDARSCDWQKYPYRLRGLAWALLCSHHDSEIQNFKRQGVHAHRLLKAPDRDWYLEDGQVKSTAPLEQIYLLWSDGGDVRIDLGQFVSGRLESITGSGARSALDASGVIVGREPIVVQPAASRSTADERDDRTPIQFRLNVNYCSSDDAAKENCKLLRRHMDLFRQIGLRASYWFTGLAADQIHRLDPALLQELIDRGMTIGHHGANRPPNPQPIHRIHGESWHKDVAAILEYETCAIDPETGRLDPTKTGGLKLLQQISGDRIRTTGRFFQASILYAAKTLGCEAMMGLKENTGALTDAGWFLGMKGMPDALAITPQTLRHQAIDPDCAFREIENFLARRPAAPVQSIAVLAHDHDFLQSSDRRDQSGDFWSAYERVLRWSASHAKLKVMTSQEILDRIEDDRAKTVHRGALSKIADVLAAPSDAPPEYITVDGDYLSLADAFQALAMALDHFSHDGNLPDEVITRDLLGPTKYQQERPNPTNDAHAAASTIGGEEIIAAVQGLDLSEEIPWRIAVGGRDVNPATFLHLMAQIVANIQSSGEAGVARPVPGLNVLPVTVQKNSLADPLTKLQFWTFKPERPKRQS